MSLRSSFLWVFWVFCVFCVLPTAEAAPSYLTYHYDHFPYIVTITPQRDWMGTAETWTYDGQPIVPPAELRVDGDVVPPLPKGFSKTMRPAYDRSAIMRTLQTSVASKINRVPGAVTIGKTASGAISFEGAGFPGRTVDLETATNLTIKAMETNVGDIMLPVTETQPTVTVTDPELRSQGIKELVTMGESDFSNSPRNRRHNIAVGLAKFNGHLIKAGETFSFVGVLGPVDGAAGYLRELVIKGDQTVPDYGGGLCQVSSTAYRGVWEYGFPITQRKNHSYMVNHYAPQGTDATVYPPDIDIKFLNDSPGALLMQTLAVGDDAYFFYYGTKDTRTAEIIGPFVWAKTPPPPDKIQLTLDLPPGERKKVGERVPGQRAAWFRTVTKDGTETTQGTYSIYSARPLFHLVGTDTLPEAPPPEGEVPSVFLDE